MKYRHTRIIAIGIAAVLETAGMSDAFAQDHQEIIVRIIEFIRNRLPPAWNSVEVVPDERFEPNAAEPQGEAVYDRETNLLWERDPDGTGRTWTGAYNHCTNRVVRIGTIISPQPRKGWRLPTVQELLSLIDPTQANPALPFNHPFVLGVAPGEAWTATTIEGLTEGPRHPPAPLRQHRAAWVVNIGDGFAQSRLKGDSRAAWCVRSPFPAGGDAQ